MFLKTHQSPMRILSHTATSFYHPDALPGMAQWEYTILPKPYNSCSYHFFDFKIILFQFILNRYLKGHLCIWSKESQ